MREWNRESVRIVREWNCERSRINLKLSYEPVMGRSEWVKEVNG